MSLHKNDYRKGTTVIGIWCFGHVSKAVDRLLNTGELYTFIVELPNGKVRDIVRITGTEVKRRCDKEFGMNTLKIMDNTNQLVIGYTTVGSSMKKLLH